MHTITEKRFTEIVNNFSKLKPVMVVGDVGIDKYTHGEVNRISPEAPVPVLEVKKEWYKLGLASNVSHNLSGLGVKSTLCGVIGNDLGADIFENLLEESKLSTWGIVRDTSRPTVLKERIVTTSQQICRIDYEELQALNETTSKNLYNRFSDLYADHQSIIIEDYGKNTLPEQMIKNIIKKCRSENKFVAVDPSRHRSPNVYAGANLLKPNLVEANLLLTSLGYSNEPIDSMCHILADKMSLEMVAITLGKDGMALLDTNDDGKLHIIPTMANEVFDVSGAGDTVISVLISCLSAGASLEEAAWVSNCAAGVVVGKLGTATVSRKELISFYSQMSSVLH